PAPRTRPRLAGSAGSAPAPVAPPPALATPLLRPRAPALFLPLCFSGGPVARHRVLATESCSPRFRRANDDPASILLVGKPPVALTPRSSGLRRRTPTLEIGDLEIDPERTPIRTATRDLDFDFRVGEHFTLRSAAPPPH
ncbi:unnamed protein product, partial [Urochloa humidicola]